MTAKTKLAVAPLEYSGAKSALKRKIPNGIPIRPDTKFKDPRVTALSCVSSLVSSLHQPTIVGDEQCDLNSTASQINQKPRHQACKDTNTRNSSRNVVSVVNVVAQCLKNNTKLRGHQSSPTPETPSNNEQIPLIRSENSLESGLIQLIDTLFPIDSDSLQ
ncbi:hypothetical protein WICPIJ_007828 [Wickerhamomyces pijperi]|uniref:Uncharacterized protein n=1 Tax=Wickerhamomyces pijperi TaxID=599730 RepID=A0A9P8TJR8_WICPI|nr:hypothetical protein WICPIJ_007828 [Wickerhamomyces pijperi]